MPSNTDRRGGSAAARAYGHEAVAQLSRIAAELDVITDETRACVARARRLLEETADQAQDPLGRLGS